MKINKKTKLNPLHWDFYPEGGAIIHEAVGGSTNGEDGDLYYRIRVTGNGRSQLFTEASSPELHLSRKGRRKWKTMAGAKRAMQNYHDGAFQ